MKFGTGRGCGFPVSSAASAAGMRVSTRKSTSIVKTCRGWRRSWIFFPINSTEDLRSALKALTSSGHGVGPVSCYVGPGAGFTPSGRVSAVHGPSGRRICVGMSGMGRFESDVPASARGAGTGSKKSSASCWAVNPCRERTPAGGVPRPLYKVLNPSRGRLRRSYFFLRVVLEPFFRVPSRADRAHAHPAAVFGWPQVVMAIRTVW